MLLFTNSATSPKYFRTIFLLIFVGLTSTSSIAQQINMSNTTVNSCNITLYDDGGPSGNHSTTDYTMTICSNNGGGAIQFVVNQMNISSFGSFTVYSGNSASGTSIYTDGTGTTATPVVASDSCVTIVFDGGFSSFSTESGFELVFSCLSPSCSDGIQNQNETGIDCGGSCPNVCIVINNDTCGSEIAFNGDFEIIDTAGCNNLPRSEIQSNLTSCQGWFGVSLPTSTSTAGSTPDYWTTVGCGVTPSISGTTGPCNSGDGALGFYPSVEQIQSQLVNPLVAGQEYCISMQVACNSGTSSNLFVWFHNRTFASGNGIYNLDADNGASANITTGIIGAVPQIVNPSSNVFNSTCKNFFSSFCATGNEAYVVIGGSGNGSFNSDYLIVDNFTVKEACPLDFDLQISSTSADPCISTTATLTADVTNATGGCYSGQIRSYQWSNGATSNAITVPISQTTSYTVTVTYDAGCQSTARTATYACNNILDANILTFDAHREGRVNQLVWTTENEINCNFFKAQRLNQFNQWETIGKVTATGNANTRTNYNYTDVSPLKTINYYRLIEVDLDGSLNYSRTVAVVTTNLKPSNSLIIYPNPAGANFIVEMEGLEHAQISLFNSLGQKIHTNPKLNRNNAIFDSRDLPRGIYVLSIELNGMHHTRKVQLY